MRTTSLRRLSRHTRVGRVGAQDDLLSTARSPESVSPIFPCNATWSNLCTSIFYRGCRGHRNCHRSGDKLRSDSFCVLLHRCSAPGAKPREREQVIPTISVQKRLRSAAVLDSRQRSSWPFLNRDVFLPKGAPSRFEAAAEPSTQGQQHVQCYQALVLDPRYPAVATKLSETPTTCAPS